jgi:hypothetical protein
MAVGIYWLRPSKMPHVGAKPGNIPIGKESHAKAPPRPRPEEMSGGEKDVTTQGQSQGRTGEDKSSERR